MTRGLGGQSPANLTHHLKGVQFPATKEDMIKQAQKNGAERDIIEVIQQLPDQEYDSMSKILEGYGEERRAS
jgi:hypothetical protein